jgi:hypothetical protein
MPSLNENSNAQDNHALNKVKNKYLHPNVKRCRIDITKQALKEKSLCLTIGDYMLG